jgi:hypothetical protein
MPIDSRTKLDSLRENHRKHDGAIYFSGEESRKSHKAFPLRISSTMCQAGRMRDLDVLSEQYQC